MVDQNGVYIILAGVGKAGTSSLFLYLSQHPDICASDIKEINYFSPLRFSDKPLESLEKYLIHFPACNNKIFLEGSPGYYYGGSRVANYIFDTLPNSKIIIIFREPISRIISFINFYKSRLILEKNLSLRSYLRQIDEIPEEKIHLFENQAYWGLEECYYDDYVLGWLEKFPRERLKILFFEKFIQDIPSTLIEICSWLGIESEEYLEKLVLTIENKTFSFRNSFLQRIALIINKSTSGFWRKYPEVKNSLRSLYYSLNGSSPQTRVDQETLDELKIMFKPHNQNLAKILRDWGYEDTPEWLVNELPDLNKG